MFGFVNVYKDLLRICDYNLFRGYYCGLCKRLGRHYNQFARLGLSYDMTFLAILLSALEDGAYTVKPERCLVHPLQKHPVIRGDAAIDYSADVAVMLTHLKLRDDMLDEKSVKSALADVCYVRPVRKARRQYEALYAHMHAQLLKSCGRWRRRTAQAPMRWRTASAACLRVCSTGAGTTARCTGWDITLAGTFILWMRLRILKWM